MIVVLMPINVFKVLLEDILWEHFIFSFQHTNWYRKDWGSRVSCTRYFRSHCILRCIRIRYIRKMVFVGSTVGNSFDIVDSKDSTVAVGHNHCMSQSNRIRHRDHSLKVKDYGN